MKSSAILLALYSVAVVTSSILRSDVVEPVAANQEVDQQLDPAAWGSDHVGQPIPEFVSGDECLFCHRKDIGSTWSDDPHATTVRRLESEKRDAWASIAAIKKPAADAEFLMGRDRSIRLLKRNPAYGSLAILSARLLPDGTVIDDNRAEGSDVHWKGQEFGQKCAGCHATAVDHATESFSALSLDCYVCHGNASLDHSNDSSTIHLSKKRDDEARVVISVCGQCHIRTGKSRSTGSPFPNNFIAGDNLFRDFEVDLSDEAIAGLNPADRHILKNIRDVVVHGVSKTTCLSCHQVHGNSSRKHHRVLKSPLCLDCHYESGPKSKRKSYEVHSKLCDY